MRNRSVFSDKSAKRIRRGNAFADDDVPIGLQALGPSAELQDERRAHDDVAGLTAWNRRMLPCVCTVTETRYQGRSMTRVAPRREWSC